MAALSEAIYFRSPVMLQQLAVAAYGWWWYRRRFNDITSRLVQEFRARERWSAEQLAAYQEAQLGQVLQAAWRSTYYRESFRQAGIRVGCAPFDILRQASLLSKESLRTRARELLTRHPLPRGTMVQKTSGTTGTPTEIYYSRELHALEMAAAEARSLLWGGVSHRDRRVMFGVRKVCRFDQDRPPFWRFSPAEDLAYASIYHLSPRFLPAYLDFLREYKPTVITGYPSALYTVAQYALQHDALPAVAGAVVTCAEAVLPHMREAIEAAWKCRLYDRYGAVECCLFVSQCEHGRYHVSPDVGIIEILDANGHPCPPGVTGEVVCTGLHNTLQPLIRYRIGDAARWALEQECPCGRNFPILESVEGRYEDLCYTRDGREMLRFDTVFKGIEAIREAQIVQEHLDSFLVVVAPAEGFSDHDAARIQANMRLHVGDVRVRVERVAAIPRSPSGKFRAVICRIPPEERLSLSEGGRHYVQGQDTDRH